MANIKDNVHFHFHNYLMETDPSNRFVFWVKRNAKQHCSSSSDNDIIHDRNTTMVAKILTLT